MAFEAVKNNRSGLNYGFVGGYKQFFTPNLGLRYYVNLDLHHNMSKHKDDVKKLDIIAINYGVNVDFLGNFIAENGIDFGAFIGLGIGGNTWSSKDLDDFEDREVATVAQAVGQIWKLSKTSFDLSLNVGLRTNIATNHGLEVAVRVPFLPVTLMKQDGIKTTLGQTYNVLARYTFSF